MKSFDNSIRDFHRDLVRISRRDPRLALHFVRTALAQRKAAARRREAARAGVQVPPFMIMSVTRRCNLRCAGCFVQEHGQPAGDELTMAEIGTILREAHMAVEQITMDREVMHLRDSLIPRYAEMIYNGYWFSPEREMLQVLIDDSQKSVNGIARIKLYKGHCRTVGRKSESDSLFNLDFATFEKDQVFNQADAEGFIKINSLRLRIRSLMQANRKR